MPSYTLTRARYARSENLGIYAQIGMILEAIERFMKPPINGLMINYNRIADVLYIESPFDFSKELKDHIKGFGHSFYGSYENDIQD